MSDVLTLKKPIIIGDKEITELEFFEVEAGDLESVPLSNQKLGDYFPVLSKITRQPLPIIRKLSVADLTVAIERVQNFL
jgi:hypothetical protein